MSVRSSCDFSQFTGDSMLRVTFTKLHSTFEMPDNAHFFECNHKAAKCMLWNVKNHMCIEIITIASCDYYLHENVSFEKKKV